MEQSQRIKNLPPYLFKEIDRLRTEVEAQGVDIINVSIGDPDRPTPEPIVAAAQAALADPANHRYPSYVGLLEFRQAVASWFEGRFGVSLDPASQVLALIGSKEGVAHLPLAFVDPGDVVLCPSPAYPVYATGTMFAGGQVFEMPLLAENGFFPDLKAIPAETAARAKMMWLNYPNNPTSAVASLDQFREVVDFARANNIIICHDTAYSEMTFGGYVAPSILEAPGAMDCTIELHSLSKTFQMTGWRIGMAVGNAQIVQGLAEIKSNVDSGVFQALQEAAIAGLALSQEEKTANQAVYSQRREVVVQGLKRLGLEFWPSQATFYVWAKVPQGLTSAQWATRLLEEAGVVVTPGNGFGQAGEGWFRIALSVGRDRLREMIDRMERLTV
ncbi:MAG: LL-diaminopimelate aminotransferase [Deltaproteobacteria bacterium]|nr:LL-diaminopimelate aminotransferase [Deltaproteobacteria bacterium]